ncbi:hypothetical protein CLOP_g9015, partial [Closterium sp. NIES-67]
LPTWLRPFIQLFNLALFAPDVIAPACATSFGYVQEWAVTMLVPLIGLLAYATLFALRKLYLYIVKYRSTAATVTTPPSSAPAAATATAADAATSALPATTAAADSAAAAAAGSKHGNRHYCHSQSYPSSNHPPTHPSTHKHPTSHSPPILSTTP